MPQEVITKRRRMTRWTGALALIVGLVCICLTTEPGPQRIPWPVLHFALWLCQAVFMIQFAVRMAYAIRAGAAIGYLGSAHGFVDGLAALAVPLALLAGGREPEVWLAGIVWVMKLINVAPGVHQLKRVIIREARSLASVACLFVIILFLAAAALFALERAGQPAEFGSLRQSLWWAIVTLTTVGYGDIVPKTDAGRLIAGSVMIFGLCVFGLWTGIIATAFAAEAKRQDFLDNWDLVAKVPFLRSLNASGMATLAHALRRMDVPENTELFRRGQDGDCMYFVVSGEVEVDVQPQPVRLGAGSFFGEVALLAGGVRNATVSTVRPSTLLVLDVMDFHTMAAQHSELARAVEAEAQHRTGHRPTPP